MAIISIFIAVILGIVGIVGAILPGLPGPQLGYLALFILQFTLKFPFSREFLIIRGIITIAITVLDYLLPIRGTKKFWGTKRGTNGCIIGMIIGLFAGPIGVIVGPFVGALLWEYLAQNDRQKATKSARWAFLGFLSGILIKLIISIVFFIYLIGISIQYFL